jgi:hypothetical protein
VKRRNASKELTVEVDTSVANFLAQPAYHADENFSIPAPPAVPDDENALQIDGTLKRVRKLLHRFLFEKPASQYSSISPRTANGGRTKIFPFNGNGKGRSIPLGRAGRSGRW